RPALERGDGRADARRDRSGSRLGIAQDAAEGALAREPDDDGPAESGQHVEPADELEILLDRLAEADPGIEADPILGDARVYGDPEPLLEERRDFGGDVVVARIELHRPGLAAHVHEAQ